MMGSGVAEVCLLFIEENKLIKVSLSNYIIRLLFKY